MSEKKIHKASCHCGKVKFEVEGVIENLVRCNCSICKRRAHIMWFVPKSDITFISGEDEMKAYQFGGKIISHRFCNACGVATMSDGDDKGVIKAGLNLNCFEDLDLEGFEIYDHDGAST